MPQYDLRDVNEPIIKVRTLCRHYQMGGTTVKALDCVDFDVHPGDFIMVVGSSGSGKSTLMHLIGLLDQPTSGCLLIDGDDMAQCRDGRLSRMRNRSIGFVFQQFNLLNDLTITENVALSQVYCGRRGEDRRTRARACAAELGLGDRLTHLPSELSGGQLQRTAIARALVNDPRLILADEPTGNLDSKTSREIMGIFHELHDRGHTIIMVTHDPDLAEQGTRKVTMSDGQIVSDVPGRKTIDQAAVGELAASLGGGASEDTGEGGGLGFFDLLRIGVREGLMAHRMRTFLTMLGIIIGVSSVIAMSSFSLGSKKKQEDQIRELGANLVRVIDKRLENERLTEARMSGSNGLCREDLALLRTNIPAIERAACVREIKLNVLHRGRGINPRVLGVSGEYLDVNNLRVSSGRYFERDDTLLSRKVAVVGHGIAGQLNQEGVIGEKLLLGGTPYTVVGVLADKNIDLEELEATSISDPNNDLLVPLETLLTRTAHLDLRSEIDEIQLQLESEEFLHTAGRAIKRVLGVTHQGVSDYDLVIPMDLLKQKHQAQRLLDILTICISSISIVVGGIGIMNIMLASVTERIREIGIRRAVGATRSDILYQFLSESMLISITGGIVGVALALAAVFSIGTVLEIPVVFSMPLLGIAVVASTVTGLVFGLYPAYQAANKNPVDALRYE